MPTSADPTEISAYLESLYQRYDGFDVNQTTVSVGDEEFQSVDERGDVARVCVHVTGPEGWLAVPGESGWVMPDDVVDDPLPPAPSTVVREQTGLDPTIEGLQEVTLVCLQSENGDGEVRELSAVYEATVDGGSPAGDAEWRDRLSEPPRPF